MFVIGSNSASTDYNLTRSLRFRASASAYLTRTLASSGNRQTWTWSYWIKRGTLSTGQIFLGTADASGNYGTYFYWLSGDTLRVQDYSTTGVWTIDTTQVFRDPSSWYHIVLAVDTTQATAANRVKIYVNGSQVTALTTATYPSLNYSGYMNSNANPISIGRMGSYNSAYGDMYMAEANFIDGLQLTPSSFGSTNALTGVWQPASYTGAYGTNGFELNFTDNSALTTSSNVGLGKDFSGNGNYFTTNNISITAGVTYDSMTDVPTLTSATAANFAVLNPLGNAVSTAVSAQISNANLKYSGSSSGGCAATMALPAGKYYFETTISAIYGLFVGLGTDARNLQADYGTVNTNIYGWYINPTISLVNNGTSTTWTSNTVTAGTVVNLAIDASNLSSVKVWLGKANVYYDSSAGTTGNPSTGANPTLTITAGINLYPNLGFYGGGTSTIEANFGQRPFTYTAPTGFVALNTYNLPTSTIVKGNTVMDATLWTGNSTGSTTQTITNAGGFKPDFLWGKSRSAAYNHVLIDSVRGVSKILYSDLTNAEVTNANTLSSFNSNGFTVGIDAGGLNDNGKTFVGWQWQAGQGSTSSNTNGTITSTVSVNASAGFSVVTFSATGSNATVGHGLGVAPSLVILKDRATVNRWLVYHTSLGATQGIYLEDTLAASTSSTFWNNTAPTSSTVSVGTWSYSGNQVMYCWTPIAGFSAFGSYTGNGSADGVFVYFGFKPRFVLIKRTDGADSWCIWDTARNTYNAVDELLLPNSASAAITPYPIDVLSNGMKARGTNTAYNASGGTYIYAAFASNPFRNSLAQ